MCAGSWTCFISYTVFNHLWCRSWHFQCISLNKKCVRGQPGKRKQWELFIYRPTCSFWWKWCFFKEDWPTFSALFSCLVLSLVHAWVVLQVSWPVLAYCTCVISMFLALCVVWVSADVIASLAHCLAVSGFGRTDCGLNDGWALWECLHPFLFTLIYCTFLLYSLSLSSSSTSSAVGVQAYFLDKI